MYNVCVGGEGCHPRSPPHPMSPLFCHHHMMSSFGHLLEVTPPFPPFVMTWFMNDPKTSKTCTIVHAFYVLVCSELSGWPYHGPEVYDITYKVMLLHVLCSCMFRVVGLIKAGGHIATRWLVFTNILHLGAERQSHKNCENPIHIYTDFLMKIY